MTSETSETRKPSKGDVATLERIAAEDVTYRMDLGGRFSYRLWSTKHDYTTCTPAARRVLERKWAKRTEGWSFGRGVLELTDLGRAVLGRHIGGPSDV